MPNRQFNNGNYRYGMNGKEKDDEIKGDGNSYDFGARIYDPRLGRWLTTDPMEKKYPNQSPYNFAMDNPIFFIDIAGEDITPTPEFLKSKNGKVYQKLSSANSVYKELLSKYDKSAVFNFKLDNNNDKVGPKKNANTFSAVSKDKTSGAVIGVDAESFYLSTPNDAGMAGKEHSEIFRARVLLHEAGHGYLQSLGKDDTGPDSENHEKYASQLQGKILAGLKEYNSENKLGYSDEELDALSWAGLGNSKAYENHLKELSMKEFGNDKMLGTEQKKIQAIQNRLKFKTEKGEEPKSETPAKTEEGK